MQDVSAKMMKRFAECLAEQMSGAPAAQAETPAAAEPAASNGGGTGDVAPTGVPGASSGVSTAEAEPKIPSASSGTSTAAQTRPTDDVLDVAEVSREAVLKRVAPVVGVLVVLFLLRRLLKR
jgi:hypothetical protein